MPGAFLKAVLSYEDIVENGETKKTFLMVEDEDGPFGVDDEFVRAFEKSDDNDSFKQQIVAHNPEVFASRKIAYGDKIAGGDFPIPIVIQRIIIESKGGIDALEVQYMSDYPQGSSYGYLVYITADKIEEIFFDDWFARHRKTEL